MPLHVPDPPQDSLAALRDALGALAERGQFSARGLRRARPEQLSATVPHQVFVLGLRDAADGAVLDRAQPVGWRYLLEVEQEVVASAETRSLEDGRHSFSLVNDGPFVRGTVEALALAESVADKEEGAVELRLLHVPALYLMSVWLRPSGAEEAEGGRFIPIAPAPSGIEAGRVYESAEFLARVRELAQAVPELTPDDTRGGG